MGRGTVGRCKIVQPEFAGTRTLRARHLLSLDLAQRFCRFRVLGIEGEHAQHRLRRALVVARTLESGARLQILRHTAADRGSRSVELTPKREVVRGEDRQDLPLRLGRGKIAGCLVLQRELTVTRDGRFVRRLEVTGGPDRGDRRIRRHGQLGARGQNDDAAQPQPAHPRAGNPGVWPPSLFALATHT